MNTDFSAIKVTLASNGVIAYPTEAVFGLGCDPRSDVALSRILDIKGREAHKGFILIAASQTQLAPYIKPIPPDWQSQLDAAWPGPVTFVVPAAAGTSSLLTGGRNTLAVRVSNHPDVVALCNGIDHALVSTSANRSGHPPLRSTDDIKRVFGAEIDQIHDGHVGSLASPTRIIDLQSGKQLRP